MVSFEHYITDKDESAANIRCRNIGGIFRTSTRQAFDEKQNLQII